VTCISQTYLPKESDMPGADSLLFTPLQIRGVTSRNRVMVSPMCQYAAQGGLANDYHLVHLGRFALGGAGIVIAEATAVEECGRISNGDLGLWSDEQIAPLKRVANFLRAQDAVPGIQLGHAGRKAATQAPWHGNGSLGEADRLRGDAPWPVIGPSPIAAGEGWQVPSEMAPEIIQRVVDSWGNAARRAHEAGFDVIDLHGAHGYLLHTFLSPISNQRTDEYGGSLENRMRFPLAVVDAIRRNWPAEKALFYRLSVLDGIDGGWTIEDSEVFCRALLERGVDVIDCSSGGAIADRTRDTRIRRGFGFHVPYSARIRKATGGLVATVGLVVEPEQAEAILRAGEADIIAVGREFQYNANWAVQAEVKLGRQGFDHWHKESGWWLDKRASVLRKLQDAGETPLDRYRPRAIGSEAE